MLNEGGAVKLPKSIEHGLVSATVSAFLQTSSLVSVSSLRLIKAKS